MNHTIEIKTIGIHVAKNVFKVIEVEQVLSSSHRKDESKKIKITMMLNRQIIMLWDKLLY